MNITKNDLNNKRSDKMNLNIRKYKNRQYLGKEQTELRNNKYLKIFFDIGILKF